MHYANYSDTILCTYTKLKLRLEKQHHIIMWSNRTSIIDNTFMFKVVIIH